MGLTERYIQADIEAHECPCGATADGRISARAWDGDGPYDLYLCRSCLDSPRVELAEDSPRGVWQSICRDPAAGRWRIGALPQKAIEHSDAMRRDELARIERERADPLPPELDL
jgi:hypothetical protein